MRHSRCSSMTTILFLLVFLSVTPALSANDGWTPKGMIGYRSIGETAISPDGSLVAFTVTEARTDGAESSYLTHIHIVAADGSKNRQFTTGDSSCRSPQFSPDGASLAFRSSRGTSNTQVWVMPVDGGEARCVTDASRGVVSYDWSPDGTTIAYLSGDPVTETVQTAISEKRDWTDSGDIPSFTHLYMVAIKGGKTKRLTCGQFHINSFDWSPDGTTIVFSHRISPSPDTWSTTDISVVTVADGTVKPLVNRPGADRYPKYSPDGRWIAFPSDADDPHWALLSDMYIVPAEGGEPKKLAETPDRNFMYYGSFLAWSHDGSEMFVREASRTSWRIFAIPFDGGEPRMITTGPGNVSGASFNDTGIMAFVHEKTDTPEEVFISHTKLHRPVQLTDLHAGQPRFSLGKTETITWKSKDKREIEGLLTYPVDYDNTRKYPLILYIHGGPASVHTESYTGAGNKYPIQAFTQAGYAVLRVNPRGSSGYGKEFRYANINDWGYGDFDDQMTGVDTVIDMGIAHPDSLCVTGWSYGGFMTAMTVTRTNRFKAAVMGAGISNLVSFTGTADIPNFIPDYFKGEPWEQTKSYIRHSPVFGVDKAETPTLVLHGEIDARVPVSQGKEFHNALKQKGCPTRLVIYPRTYHSPSEPKFVIDVGERIIGWFDTHLKRR